MKFKSELNKLAYPIFLSYLIEVIFTLFDKMIIGRINTVAFNSVSFMSNLLYVIIGALGVLTTVFNIFINKTKNKEKYLNHFLTLSIIIGVIIELIFIFTGNFLITKLYNLNGAALKYAYTYLVVAGPTVLLNLMIFIFSSYFRSCKNSVINTKVTFISLVINLIIDYTLVFVFDLDVLGCSIGTTIGLLIGVLIYAYNTKGIKFKLIFDKKINKDTKKLYFPLLTTELIESTLFTIMLANIISRLSTYTIGVYNIIETINGILILIIYAYSSASVTLSLQEENEKHYLKASSLSLKLMLICSVFVIIFNKPISRIITNDLELVNMVNSYIICGLISIIFNSYKIIYKDLLNALDCEKFVLRITFITMLISLIILYSIKPNLNVIYIILAAKIIIESLIYYLKVQKIKRV